MENNNTDNAILSEISTFDAAIDASKYECNDVKYTVAEILNKNIEFLRSFLLDNGYAVSYRLDYTKCIDGEAEEIIKVEKTEEALAEETIKDENYKKLLTFLLQEGYTVSFNTDNSIDIIQKHPYGGDVPILNRMDEFVVDKDEKDETKENVEQTASTN